MTLASMRRHAAEVRAMLADSDVDFRNAVEDARSGTPPPPPNRWKSYTEIREAQIDADIERELHDYGRVMLSSPGMEPLDNDPSAWSALDAMRRGGQRDGGKEVRR